jgi:hypothetical protein
MGRELIIAVFLIIIFLSLISLQLSPIPISDTARKRQFSFPNCTLCDIFPVTSSSSTTRDLVITATTSRISRLELLVRSLRSVGSQARVLVIVPRGLEIPDNLRFCGVESFEVSSISSRTLRSPHKIRWEWYYQYLSRHLHEFDRIFHTDAFDAYFQGDPFLPSISARVLYLMSEGRLIKTCHTNSHWVSKCFGVEALKQIQRNEVICSGSAIGGAKPFFELVKMMVNRSGWDDCWQKAHDQGFLNYLVYTDLIGRIPVKIFGCGSRFVTMAYCSASQLAFFDWNGRILSPYLLSTPVYLHQYNRYRNVDAELQRKCGIVINRTAEIELTSSEWRT